MKVRVLSQEKLLLKYLFEQIDNRENHKQEGYSSNIDFGLSELVRFYIRKIAQETEYMHEREGDLLHQAMKTAENRLTEELRNKEIPFDFNKYFRNIVEKLKYIAQEVEGLRYNLVRAKGEQRVKRRQRLIEASKIPIEITEMGLSGFVDGLLAKPILDILEGYEVNLGNLQYSVEGDWFPFEVIIEDFVFTIDDDGTIFVSVENLPPRLVLQAKEMLQVLANQLYIA